MKRLSDETIQRLQSAAGRPDTEGTRYRLLERVDCGGMGVVWSAEDLRLNRRVALKILDPPQEADDLEARLIQEARILALLEHPGIVPVHDVGTLPDGRVFYAMKFVQGQRLDRHLARVPSRFDRLRVFQQICDAVAFAHVRGVLHRDLKPENVMVGPFGEVLVMDWGVARVQGTRDAATDARESAGDKRDARTAQPGTGHGVILGTPGYMAPEQAEGRLDDVDVRADVYSLGALLHFMIGAPEFVEAVDSVGGSRATGEAVGASPSPSSGSKSRIPRALAAVCRKAMAQDPAQRYPDVAGLMADVARFLEGQPVSAHAESLFERLERLYDRHRTAILLILTYVLVRALILFFGRR